MHFFHCTVNEMEKHILSDDHLAIRVPTPVSCTLASSVTFLTPTDHLLHARAHDEISSLHNDVIMCSCLTYMVLA